MKSTIKPFKIPKGIPLKAPGVPRKLDMLKMSMPVKPLKMPKSVTKISNQQFRRGGKVGGKP